MSLTTFSHGHLPKTSTTRNVAFTIRSTVSANCIDKQQGKRSSSIRTEASWRGGGCWGKELFISQLLLYLAILQIILESLALPVTATIRFQLRIFMFNLPWNCCQRILRGYGEIKVTFFKSTFIKTRAMLNERYGHKRWIETVIQLL